MATFSLYQKYRPHDFKSVIGQDHIVETIKKQLESDQVAHAYLFYGSRGLGKTTIARLLAKSLEIASEDLYEIDAASNRGIDDIRDIREGVKARPFSSPYKMYLIDEVHMLTKEAFNALLKTLEEPPVHAIFVLATTELHKVPDTIKSRTQVYNFKTPGLKDLQNLLQDVAKKEGYELNDEMAHQIAQKAEGSYRDALGQLQIYLTNPEAYQQNGSEIQLIEELVKALITDDSTNISDLVGKISIAPDPKQLYLGVVNMVSDKLRDKLQGQGDELSNLVTSAHLSALLDIRGYFTGTDVSLHRAGLWTILDKIAQ